MFQIAIRRGRSAGSIDVHKSGFGVNGTLPRLLPALPTPLPTLTRHLPTLPTPPPTLPGSGLMWIGSGLEVD